MTAVAKHGGGHILISEALNILSISAYINAVCTAASMQGTVFSVKNAKDRNPQHIFSRPICAAFYRFAI